MKYIFQEIHYSRTAAEVMALQMQVGTANGGVDRLGLKDIRTVGSAAGEHRGTAQACGLPRLTLNFYASCSYRFQSTLFITSKLFPVCTVGVWGVFFLQKYCQFV